MMSGRSLRLQRASLHNIMPKPRRVGLGQRQLNTQLHQQPSPTSASSASEPQSSAETASEAKQGEMPPAQAAEVIVDAAKSKASRIADGLLASKVKAKAYAQNLLVGAMFLTAALMAALPFCATGPLAELLANRVFMCGFWAWLTAQVLKIFTKRFKKGVWDLKALVEAGGMPSSHSALCMGVTAAIGVGQGFNSPLFAAAAAFSSIVMYDAAGVRRHAGYQAEVLNQLIIELVDDHPVREIRLKEVLGHTPRQVVAGAVLGVAFGLWLPVGRPA